MRLNEYGRFGGVSTDSGNTALAQAFDDFSVFLNHNKGDVLLGQGAGDTLTDLAITDEYDLSGEKFFFRTHR